MAERLLLYGIDAEPGGTAVGGEHDLVILPRAHETHAALPFVQLAKSRAEIALYTAVGQGDKAAVCQEGRYLLVQFPGYRFPVFAQHVDVDAANEQIARSIAGSAAVLTATYLAVGTST